jgi:hypothetical protein
MNYRANPRIVYLCAAPNGMMISDSFGSTRPTHIAVADVPATVSTSDVALQVGKMIFWPWPRKPISWARIAGLKEGAFIRNADAEEVA